MTLGKTPRKGDSLYTVTFSANFHAQIWARDEDRAAALAAPIAARAAATFGDMTVQEEDWISIHDDDIVRITKEET